MNTYPNQKAITIKKEKVVKDFLQIGNNDWKEAYKKLAPSSFAIYLYFTSNADNFTLMFAPSIVTKELNISESSIRRAMKELEEKEYLVAESGSNTKYFFYPSAAKNEYIEIKNDEVPVKNEYQGYSKMNTSPAKNEYMGYSKMNTENIYNRDNIYSTEKIDSPPFLEGEYNFGEKQGEFKKAIADLRKKGFSDEWIKKAVDKKERSVFMNKGFGLLFYSPYQEEVTAEIDAVKARVEHIANVWENHQPEVRTIVVKKMPEETKKRKPQLISFEEIIDLDETE